MLCKMSERPIGERSPQCLFYQSFLPTRGLEQRPAFCTLELGEDKVRGANAAPHSRHHAAAPGQLATPPLRW